MSSGQNLSETTLTPSNVNSAEFGKLFSRTVDGQVYAQPLVKTGVSITTGSHQGTHDVIFVATEHDSVYAIDAHTGVPLWHDSFIAPNIGVTSVPFAELTPNPDITPEVGITGTPVIDPAANVLYVVAKTREDGDGQTHYVQRLHARSLSDGSEQMGGPAVIGDTIFDPNADFTYVSGPFVFGSGDGAQDGKVYFNAMREMNRPGLTLANGRLYIAFGSHGDNGPYHGWVLGYDPSNLQLKAAWNTTPNGGLGGIWQGGGITAVDSDGYLYFETGNGTFDENLDANGLPSSGNYGDSFVKLAVDNTTTADNQNINGWGLKVVDYFTPFNEAAQQQRRRPRLRDAHDPSGFGWEHGPSAPADRRGQGGQALPDRPRRHGQIRPLDRPRRSESARCGTRPAVDAGVLQRHAVRRRRLRRRRQELLRQRRPRHGDHEVARPV